MQVNVSYLDLLRRPGLADIMGSLDTKRPNAWAIYGYKDQLTFDDYLAVYERHPVAHGAVHRILDGCWQKKPRIKQAGTEEETTFEKKIKGVIDAINGWAKLKDFDRRNMVGRYAGLIYRVNDGLALNQPLVSAKKLVDVVPVYEGQLKVTAWNSDMDSADYGKPAMFQYRRRQFATSDTQGQPDEWADVHPSRVQILAEGSVGDMFDGVPLAKAAYNSLCDLEKVAGGSAEGFLKNSSRTLTFEYDTMAEPENKGENGEKVDVREAHNLISRSVNSNIDAAIVTQGATVGTVQTTNASPTPSFEVAANMAAAAYRLPFTILFGQQTGRLASDQDKADANARYKSRQETELTPMLREFVERQQAIGTMDQGDFEIEWEDISAPSDTEKLSNAEKMANISKTISEMGQGPAFDVAEVRKVAGYEPLVSVAAPPDPVE